MRLPLATAIATLALLLAPSTVAAQATTDSAPPWWANGPLVLLLAVLVALFIALVVAVVVRPDRIGIAATR